MKKQQFLFLICFFLAASVWSQRQVRVEDRFLEIGLNVGFNFSNNLLSAGEIFQNAFVFNIDDIGDGLRMNLGAGITPLFLNFNSKKGWGFGLSAGVEGFGIFNLSEKLLSLSETDVGKEDNSEVSGAVFAEAAISGFFTARKFKIKFKPALYYPVLYAASEIKYTYLNTDDGTIANIVYDINVYSIFSMEDYSFDSFSSFTSVPGIDLYLGVEYPLSQVLGLHEKHSLLDFNVGMDIIGIPLLSSRMMDYMVLKGNIGSDDPFKFFGEDSDIDSLIDINDAEYGTEKRTVHRPFKLLTYLDWHPLRNRSLLTVTPSLGFSYFSLYDKPFSLEAGIKARLDFFNQLIFSLGTGYHDRLWKNGFDFALNFRVFEFNFSAALCSPEFLSSWTNSGFSLNTGIKFGW